MNSTETNVLIPGDQLFVNNKWYFDVTEAQDSIIVVRVRYKENPKVENYIYRTIAIEKNLIKDITPHSFVKKCKIDERTLRNVLGSLVDRIAKEQDVTTIFEDASLAGPANTAGMGAVVMPGINSTPGVMGSFGSGDKPATKMKVQKKLPSNAIGLEILPKERIKQRKKIKTHKGTPIVKNPILDLTKSKVSEALTDDDTVNDLEFKNNFFAMLDYPTDNETDMIMIDAMNGQRKKCLNVSGEIIKRYIKDFYTLNKTRITSECSEWFQNQLMVLGDIENNEETV